ncbi:hypothetical protein [Streptomyces sp. NPDC051921]|uniref:hypothetical protein n=1 Tax=Streptomyces sp. NPDC051921 TaxID=3155806 RepID=UPI0034307064
MEPQPSDTARPRRRQPVEPALMEISEVAAMLPSGAGLWSNHKQTKNLLVSYSPKKPGFFQGIKEAPDLRFYLSGASHWAGQTRPR